MVFNSLLVVSVAHASADTWQYLTCLPEQVSSNQLMDIVFCLPLQQLSRLALCLWTFLCVPPSDSYYSDSDSDASSTVDYDDSYYDSHSD